MKSEGLDYNDEVIMSSKEDRQAKKPIELFLHPLMGPYKTQSLCKTARLTENP